MSAQRGSGEGAVAAAWLRQQRLIGTGQLEAVSVGCCYRIRDASVQRLLRGGTSPPP